MEALILLILIALYFLPTAIAKDHPYCTGIFILNLVGGWTVIGWVAALIWAVSNPRNVAK